MTEADTGNSHGGLRPGAGRKRKRSGRPKALAIYNQLQTARHEIRTLERQHAPPVELKSTLTVAEQRRREGEKFLAKVAKTLTFERFINALILAGVMEQLMSADTSFDHLIPIQQAFCLDFIDPTKKTVGGICTRGGSKTLLGSLCASYLEFKISRFKTSLLSGSKGQNEQFCSYLDIICAAFPQALLKNNLESKTWYNGSRFYSLPSTQTGARSKRADLLILDEAVEIYPAVIRGALGQKSSSRYGMLRFMTTPHLDGNNEMIKDICDRIEMEHPGNAIIYNWPYTACPWINVADVLEDKRIMSFEEFKAEYLGQWGAKTGGVYIHEQIDASLMEDAAMQEIIEQTFASPLEWGNGIDWGDIHLTADVEMFEWHGILYVSDMITFDVEENKEKDKVIEQIVAFARKRHHQHANHIVNVHSEAAPIATSDNHRLEGKLRPHGIKLYRSAFGAILDKDIDPKELKGIKRVPKENFLQSAIARFNHGTIRINKKLVMLIKQLKNAIRDENGELLKGNDDCHDGFLHGVQAFDTKKHLKYHSNLKRHE